MTVSKDGKEYNILGAKVRVTFDAAQDEKAQKAIDCVLHEASSLKKNSSSLKDQDIAVLVALKLATKCLEIEKEYKDNVLLLKDEVLKAKENLTELSASFS